MPSAARSITMLISRPLFSGLAGRARCPNGRGWTTRQSALRLTGVKVATPEARVGTRGLAFDPGVLRRIGGAGGGGGGGGRLRWRRPPGGGGGHGAAPRR